MTSDAGNRGRRWRAGLLAPLALVVVMLGAGTASAAAAPRADATAVEAANCARTVVNGRIACVRAGQPCVRRHQRDYLRAGLTCRRGRLRPATPAQIRGPEPYVLGPDGRMTFATALAVFDQAVADLPGVAAKPGEIGRVDDASGAIRVISANLERLTPRQLAVFRTLTTPAADAVVIPVDGAAPVAPPLAASAVALGDVPDQAEPGLSSCKPASTDELILAQEYIGLARDALRAQGFPLTRAVRLCFLDVEFRSKGRLTDAYVTADDLPPTTPQSPTCNMFITKTGRAATGAEKQFIFAHEYVHCIQHQYVDDDDQYARWPEWVAEGSADWLAGVAVEASGLDVDGVDWRPWLKHPEIDLFRRAYDAAGFWAMIHQATGQGQQRLRDVFSAAKGGSAPAYARALAGLPDAFHDRWGARHAPPHGRGGAARALALGGPEGLQVHGAPQADLRHRGGAGARGARVGKRRGPRAQRPQGSVAGGDPVVIERDPGPQRQEAPQPRPEAGRGQEPFEQAPLQVAVRVDEPRHEDRVAQVFHRGVRVAPGERLRRADLSDPVARADHRALRHGGPRDRHHPSGPPEASDPGLSRSCRPPAWGR